MLLNLDKEDVEFIKERYPALIISQENPLKISGILKFHAKFQEEEIRDNYEIELEHVEGRVFPRIKEIGSKIADVAREKRKRLEDMHINTGDVNSVCLCSPLEEKLYEKQDLSVRSFIEKYVVPFFYEQSYFSKNNRWPWGEYGHGIIGVLESYLDYKTEEETVRLFLQVLKEHCLKYNINYNRYGEQLKQKTIKGRNRCPVCVSGMRWEKCHEKSLEALRKLKKDMGIFSVEI